MGRKTTIAANGKPTVQISSTVKNRFAQWLKDNRNPSQGATLACVIEWFLNQPVSVQQVVLGQYPPEMREPYAAALELMAAQVRKDGLIIQVAGKGVIKK